MEIRCATPQDTEVLLSLYQLAFADALHMDKGRGISELVQNLLRDATAEPCHSLVAVEQGSVVEHVLFSWVHIEGASNDVAS